MRRRDAWCSQRANCEKNNLLHFYDVKIGKEYEPFHNSFGVAVQKDFCGGFDAGEVGLRIGILG